MGNQTDILILKGLRALLQDRVTNFSLPPQRITCDELEKAKREIDTALKRVHADDDGGK